MDKVNSNRSYTGLVQKYIGTAYDHVRRVSENLDELLKLADLDGIEDIVENITNAEKYAKLAIAAAEQAKQYRDETALIVASFNDFYLGPFITPPSSDNDGNPLVLGALYLDISKPDISMMAWVGTEWIVSYSTLSKVPHSALEALNEDDHLNYLTPARHGLISDNPHNTNFIQLNDTPDTYTDQAGKLVIVNPCEDGLEFYDLGSIQGYLPLTGGEISGNLNVTGSLSTDTDPVKDTDVITLKYFNENAIEGDYLPLTGGEVSDDIIINPGNIITQAVPRPQFKFAGLLTRDENGLDKGLFGHLGDLDATVITQMGAGALTSPDSYLILKNGLLHIRSSDDKYDVHMPTDEYAFITKGYLDKVLDGGDGGLYLPLTGGDLSGTLTVQEKLTVFTPTTGDAGVYIHDTADPVNKKGDFHWDSVTGAMVIGQKSTSGIGIVDTALHIVNGTVELVTQPGIPVDAEKQSHLATVGFVRSLVDGGTGVPYLPLIGGILSGPLQGSELISVVSKAGEPLVGFSWKDENITSKGGIGWERATGSTKITQLAPDGVTENSNVLIKDGVINVTTQTLNPTGITLPTDLVNLGYLDSKLFEEYLPLTGGGLSGNLILNHELRVIADATELNGMSLYASDGTTFKGAVTTSTANDSIQLWQQGGGPLGDPDTVLEVTDGRVKVSSFTGKSLEPTEPNHLANRQFVLDQVALVAPPGGGYLPLTGGTLTGALKAKHSMSVYSDPSDNGTGFAIYSDASEINLRGGLHFDSLTNSIHISQNNDDNTGSPDTYLSIKAGIVTMSSPSGYDVHAPNSDAALVTRKFVLDQVSDLGGPYLELSGGTVTGPTVFKTPVNAAATPSSSTHLLPRGYADGRYLKAVNNTVTGDLTSIGDIYSRQINSSDPDWGFGLKTYNNQFAASFSYDNGSKQVRITQLANGIAKTQLQIIDGKIAMFAFGGASITPIATNHLVPLGHLNTSISALRTEMNETIAAVKPIGITTTVDLPGGKKLHIVGGLIVEVE